MVALCRCKEGKIPYGVGFEKVDDEKWRYTWASPIKEESAKQEGYEGTSIRGEIEPAEDYPGCPYCGGNHFIVCQCGKQNCNNASLGELITCDWCGLTGTLEPGIGEIKTGGDR